MADNSVIDIVFNPRSIAVVNAYPGDEKNPQPNLGWNFLQNQLNAGFKGLSPDVFSNINRETGLPSLDQGALDKLLTNAP